MLCRDDKGRVQLGKFEYLVQLLIVLSLVVFALETLPGIDSRLLAFLGLFEMVTMVVFSIEYLLRLFLSKPRRAYAFSFWGIIDIVAILPFFFSTGLDLRSVRIFRLMRLFRLLKLARYNDAAQRCCKAFAIAKEELVLFGVVALILIYLSAVGIYYFENEAQPEKFSSIFHSMWWATTTLTTVGYGDAFPITTGGKLFTFFVLAIGLGAVAVPSGILASALSKVREEEK